MTADSDLEIEEAFRIAQKAHNKAKLVASLKKRYNKVAEMISDVREPILPISKPVDENEKRRKQVRLAEVRVQIMEAKQTLEECISCQDFSRAAELKDTISQLEELKNQLTLKASQPADNIKEQRVEKSDPETLLKCLTMCAELFKQMNIKRGICPTLNALIESLILPSVSNPNPAVRNMAVICLGTAALHSKDLSNTHLVLLLQITQLESESVLSGFSSTSSCSMASTSSKTSLLLSHKHLTHQTTVTDSLNNKLRRRVPSRAF
ncbi:condensin complex subunit 3-like [Sinocyclocheilus grahami]|uniref:condensin complex subunit 3-like n=1 Tax=Sinocyclocheilus grahami TaxID=75366 RepID=UPI0007ACE4DC|nr:PREDICTED: condensin complex subunit 3-like [Sinocyclocheilus grahami]